MLRELRSRKLKRNTVFLWIRRCCCGIKSELFRKTTFKRILTQTTCREFVFPFPVIKNTLFKALDREKCRMKSTIVFVLDFLVSTSFNAIHLMVRDINSRIVRLRIVRLWQFSLNRFFFYFNAMSRIIL
jgi:hypothetical protein